MIVIMMTMLMMVMLVKMLMMVMLAMIMLAFSLADNEVVKCPSNAKFAFADFQFEETLVTEWDLVCDQDYRSLGIAFYMVGLMLGSFGCGWLADRIGDAIIVPSLHRINITSSSISGRKKTFIMSAILSSTAGIVGAFMPEFFSYAFIRYSSARSP